MTEWMPDGRVYYTPTEFSIRIGKLYVPNAKFDASIMLRKMAVPFQRAHDISILKKNINKNHYFGRFFKNSEF